MFSGAGSWEVQILLVIWETLSGSHVHIPDLQRADDELHSPTGPKP